MKHLKLNPEDAQWLRRWLRSNLGFFAVTVGLLIAARYQPAMPVVTEAQASSEITHTDRSNQAPVLDPSHTDALPRSVPPTGWRRTCNGWEHVSTWQSLGTSINDLIAQQCQQEPAWIRGIFAKIRSVSPLMLALFQITAIAAIINVTRGETQTSAGH